MNTVTTRKPARAMLALITLATDLPVPEKISLYQAGDGEYRLVLDLASITDGEQWAARLHANVESRVLDGVRYLGAGLATWHGWHVHLYANEPEQPDTGITDEQHTTLTELAEADR